MKIIVIGAGHAGIEAAYAVAKMGAKVTLLTISLEAVGQMSCNPSIGGIAKGHIVKELDAFNGLMPIAADYTGIHFKTLNKSKGPAVRALRVQNDKAAYRDFMKLSLEKAKNIELYQGIVKEILVENNRVAGVLLYEGEKLKADAVIVASGTFLRGKIYIGNSIYDAGRANEPSGKDLGENLISLGFKTIRLKTGTPMRIHASGIDWDLFEKQEGDKEPATFSIYHDFKVKNKIESYMGYTSGKLLELIKNNISLSPLYSGEIKGIGPRYCPSIEDKVVKFPHRERHHIYLEREGINTNEVYVNGLSTSLPVSIQREMLLLIQGLEKAQIMRPGYAIEYDAILPNQLKENLESIEVKNLFFAGQVNGTSGYEEAGIQGLIAGINSVLAVRNEPPFIMERNEAYGAVLVKDLISTGIDEPYRMFTSRAEHRLSLREDNVYERLSPYAVKYGLIKREQYDKVMEVTARRQKIIEELKVKRTSYNGKHFSLHHLLKMPNFNFKGLEDFGKDEIFEKVNESDISYIEAEVKYEGYIKNQDKNIKRLRALQDKLIPKDIDYAKVEGLSIEVRSKLEKIRPINFAQAADIPGLTPASLTALSAYIYLNDRKKK